MLAHASIIVDREVLRRQQRFEPVGGNVPGNQAIAVLGKDRNVPRHSIQRQPNKPAEQQIVARGVHIPESASIIVAEAIGL